MAKDEPQSYGSQAEWVTGRTGQQVNRPKAEPGPEQTKFYDESRESETTAPHQGGDVSDVQLAENSQAAGWSRSTDEPSIRKVTGADGGAIRGSYFKKRDYPE